MNWNFKENLKVISICSLIGIIFVLLILYQPWKFDIKGTITKGLIGKQDLALMYSGDSAETFTRATSTGYTMTLNKIDWPGVDVCYVFGGGVTKTSTVVAAAISAVGNTEKVELYLSRGVWPVTGTLSIPANFTVHFAVGAYFDGTVAFAGSADSQIKALPGQKIFSTTSTITFGLPGEIYSAWWDSDTPSYIVYASGKASKWTLLDGNSRKYIEDATPDATTYREFWQITGAGVDGEPKGVGGLRIDVSDNADVVADATKAGILYGEVITIDPVVARNDVPNDDATGIIVQNGGTQQATDALYVGRGGSIGANNDWSTLFASDAHVLTGFNLAGNYYNYGIDFNSGTFDGSVIRFPSAKGLVSRNAANDADINLIYSDVSDSVVIGPVGSAGGVVKLVNTAGGTLSLGVSSNATSYGYISATNKLLIDPDATGIPVAIGTNAPIAATTLTVVGGIYSTADISALTFTDRTPFFEGDALAEIVKIKGEAGSIDHKSLPTFAKKEKKSYTYKEVELKTIEEAEAFDIEKIKVPKKYQKTIDQEIYNKKTNKIEKIKKTITYLNKKSDRKNGFFIDNGIVKERVEPEFEMEVITQKKIKEDVFFNEKTGRLYKKINDNEIIVKGDKCYQKVVNQTITHDERDLGAMITLLTESVKQLNAELTDLKNKIR